MALPRRNRRGGARLGPALGPAFGVVLIALAGLVGCQTGVPTTPGDSPSDGAGSGDDGADAGGDGGGATDLTITVDEAGDGANARTFTLTCDPAGGTHPQADAACAALATDAVRSALEPPPLDQLCTEQYGGPQVATVIGTLDGEPVDAQLSRTNGCGISRWAAVAVLLDSSASSSV